MHRFMRVNGHKSPSPYSHHYIMTHHDITSCCPAAVRCDETLRHYIVLLHDNVSCQHFLTRLCMVFRIKSMKLQSRKLSRSKTSRTLLRPRPQYQQCGVPLHSSCNSVLVVLVEHMCVSTPSVLLLDKPWGHCPCISWLQHIYSVGLLLNSACLQQMGLLVLMPKTVGHTCTTGSTATEADIDCLELHSDKC